MKDGFSTSVMDFERVVPVLLADFPVNPYVCASLRNVLSKPLMQGSFCQMRKSLSCIFLLALLLSCAKSLAADRRSGPLAWEWKVDCTRGQSRLCDPKTWGCFREWRFHPWPRRCSRPGRGHDTQSGSLHIQSQSTSMGLWGRTNFVKHLIGHRLQVRAPASFSIKSTPAFESSHYENFATRGFFWLGRRDGNDLLAIFIGGGGGRVAFVEQTARQFFCNLRMGIVTKFLLFFVRSLLWYWRLS